MGFIIIYLIAWVVIIKDLEFKNESNFEKNGFVYQRIGLHNKSFATIEVVDIKLKNDNDEEIKNITNDLPCIIDRNSNESILIGFKRDNYKKSIVTLKTLLLSYSFENDLESK